MRFNNAPATVKRRHESDDGRNHPCLSNCLGLLRIVDRFATGDRMEHDRGIDQRSERRRVPMFRPWKKKAGSKTLSPII
jgi:hypothetical protein